MDMVERVKAAMKAADTDAYNWCDEALDDLARAAIEAMRDAAIENLARHLCRKAGVEPDGTLYEGADWPNWHAWKDEAAEYLDVAIKKAPTD